MWIEISKLAYLQRLFQSQPARAVWIEIANRVNPIIANAVTACEGCVD